MVALEPATERSQRDLFVSIKLSLAKIVLTSWGLLAGFDR
jgi:hypothetical protein